MYLHESVLRTEGWVGQLPSALDVLGGLCRLQQQQQQEQEQVTMHAYASSSYSCLCSHLEALAMHAYATQHDRACTGTGGKPHALSCQLGIQPLHLTVVAHILACCARLFQQSVLCSCPLMHSAQPAHHCSKLSACMDALLICMVFYELHSSSWLPLPALKAPPTCHCHCPLHCMSCWMMMHDSGSRAIPSGNRVGSCNCS